MLTLRRGDEVAILPKQGAPAKTVIHIAVVASVGPALIGLDNGNMYYAMDGQGMNIPGCIVPANEEHRKAVYRRKD